MQHVDEPAGSRAHMDGINPPMAVDRRRDGRVKKDRDDGSRGCQPVDDGGGSKVGRVCREHRRRAR